MEVPRSPFRSSQYRTNGETPIEVDNSSDGTDTGDIDEDVIIGI